MNRPTVALIGESGPEAVLPSRGPPGGGGIIVNISLPASSVMFLDNEASLRRLSAVLMVSLRDTLRSRRAFT